MRIFLAFLAVAGAAIFGGLFAYKNVVGGDVYDFVDYFSTDFEISREDLSALYERERPGLIEGYQRKANPYAMAYPEYRAASTFPAKPGVHSDRYLMTYVNDVGFETYTDYGAGPMPEGSIIAKESFKLRPNGDFYPYSLFIMEKVGAEQAPDTDGWLYDRVLFDGSQGLPVSQDFCHSCHVAYAAQDSLGYPAIEARLNYTASPDENDGAALSPGDAARGEEAFQACKACHQAGPGAKNSFGPVLTGVIGRPAGTYPGFAYSGSLKKAGEDGLVWTEETIFDWLSGPSGFLKERLDQPGASSKMFFQLDDAQRRKDVIAYLNALSETAE